MAEFTGTERFELRRRLGQGGMGVVYEAFDRAHRQLVALKLLKSNEPGALVRFKQEFRGLADISHENLVTLHELFNDGTHWFFTLELVRGRHFISAIRGDRGVDDEPTEQNAAQALVRRADSVLGPATTARYSADVLRDRLRQLVNGLKALHQAGKLHRDVKQSNVLVTEEGRVVLLDFGLLANTDPAQDATLESMGTPSYMAPEHFMNEPLGAATDFYAVGVMLHEVLTGKSLFRGDVPTMLDQKMRGAVARPSATTANVPADLEELCMALLSVRPTHRPSAEEILARLGGPVRSDDGAEPLLLLGREAEMRALRRALDETRAGHSAVVVVSGVSGMGKSSLVRTFVDDLQDSTAGAIVLRGRCYENESLPFKAVDTVVDGLARVLRHLSEQEVLRVFPDVAANASALTRLFPAFDLVPLIAQSHSTLGVRTSGVEERGRAFQALRQIFSGLCARAPVVVIIDDLQWSDPDSATLVEEVLRAPNEPPLLFVGITRSNDDARGPVVSALMEARGPTTAHPTHIALDALSPADATRLAEVLLKRRGILDRALAEKMAVEARGLPFFVSELAHFANGETSGAVADLAAAIRARVQTFPREAQLLLELVCISPGPVELKAALKAAHLHDGADATIARLRGARLLRRRTREDQELLEPVHDRVRETIAASLDDDSRMDLHRRLATALVETGHADPDTLAVHLRAAGDAAGAAEWAVRAADSAAEQLAFAQAGRLYETAVEIGTWDDVRRAGLEEKRALAWTNAGSGQNAARAWLALAKLSDGKRALECQSRAGEALVRSGLAKEALEVLEAPFAAAGISPRSTNPMWWVLKARARARWRGLKFTERATPDPDAAFRADLARSVSLGMMTGGDSFAGIALHVDSYIAALDSGDPRRIADGLCREAWAVMGAEGAGALPRSEAALAAAAPLVLRLGDRTLDVQMIQARAMQQFFQFRYRDAAEQLIQIEPVLDRMQGAWADVAVNRFFVVQSLLMCERWADLDERVPRYLAEARQHGDEFAVADTTLQTTRAYLVRGDVKTGTEILDSMRPRWSARGYGMVQFVMLYYDLVAALAGRRPVDGLRRLDEELPTLKRSQLLRVEGIQHNTHFLRGLLALAAAAQKEPGDWLAAAEREAKIIRKHGAWGQGRADLLEAGVAHLRGRDDEAMTKLDRSAAACVQVDLPVQGALARYRLARLLGGDRGAQMQADAEAVLRAQGAPDAAASAVIFTPGFD